MESETPRVSFITILDFSEDARWLFFTESVSDLLGFEPRELLGRPALELVHPDLKGYILCAVSRTVVHSVLVELSHLLSTARSVPKIGTHP
ncbi:hypothetical protein P692DRAFT_20881041 [Suillus brevipes Sb2]|nr:hypothetical protein P692DRAFT_20881041 [Suillus brevipes Sb2]